MIKSRLTLTFKVSEIELRRNLFFTPLTLFIRDGQFFPAITSVQTKFAILIQLTIVNAFWFAREVESTGCCIIDWRSFELWRLIVRKTFSLGWLLCLRFRLCYDDPTNIIFTSFLTCLFSILCKDLRLFCQYVTTCMSTVSLGDANPSYLNLSNQKLLKGLGKINYFSRCIKNEGPFLA